MFEKNYEFASTSEIVAFQKHWLSVLWTEGHVYELIRTVCSSHVRIKACIHEKHIQMYRTPDFLVSTVTNTNDTHFPD